MRTCVPGARRNSQHAAGQRSPRERGEQYPFVTRHPGCETWRAGHTPEISLPWGSRPATGLFVRAGASGLLWSPRTGVSAAGLGREFGVQWKWRVRVPPTRRDGLRHKMQEPRGALRGPCAPPPRYTWGTEALSGGGGGTQDPERAPEDACLPDHTPQSCKKSVVFAQAVLLHSLEFSFGSTLLGVPCVTGRGLAQDVPCDLRTTRPPQS